MTEATLDFDKNKFTIIVGYIPKSINYDGEIINCVDGIAYNLTNGQKGVYQIKENKIEFSFFEGVFQITLKNKFNDNVYLGILSTPFNMSYAEFEYIKIYDKGLKNEDELFQMEYIDISKDMFLNKKFKDVTLDETIIFNDDKVYIMFKDELDKYVNVFGEWEIKDNTLLIKGKTFNVVAKFLKNKNNLNEIIEDAEEDNYIVEILFKELESSFKNFEVLKLVEQSL
jgi:hypothetical protein